MLVSVSPFPVIAKLEQGQLRSLLSTDQKRVMAMLNDGCDDNSDRDNSDSVRRGDRRRIPAAPRLLLMMMVAVA